MPIGQMTTSCHATNKMLLCSAKPSHRIVNKRTPERLAAIPADQLQWHAAGIQPRVLASLVASTASAYRVGPPGPPASPHTAAASTGQRHRRCPRTGPQRRGRAGQVSDRDRRRNAAKQSCQWQSNPRLSGRHVKRNAFVQSWVECWPAHHTNHASGSPIANVESSAATTCTNVSASLAFDSAPMAWINALM
eukprot:7377770-Prymnesium_polylepis.2